MSDLWFLHNRVRIPISSTETGGAFALLEVSGPPGDQPPLHVHHHDDEGFYVLEGELTLWVGDAVHVLRPGEGLLAPRGVPHTVRAGDSGGRWLVTSTPAGFEAFVRAAASADPGGALRGSRGAGARRRRARHRDPGTARDAPRRARGAGGVVVRGRLRRCAASTASPREGSAPGREPWRSPFRELPGIAPGVSYVKQRVVGVWWGCGGGCRRGG